MVRAGLAALIFLALAGPALGAETCFNSNDRSAPDIGVRADPDSTARGRVLPGRALEDQVINGGPSDLTPSSNPLAPHYPGGQYPAGDPSWNRLAGIDPANVVHASGADARFNDEDAQHRVAFHLSHYGGQPDSAGDFNGDGVEDFLVTEHFSYVDGMKFAGEVHLYFAERGKPIDPTFRVPDIIFYGDEPEAKLGLSIVSAGDMNGDGWTDIAMSASFRSLTQPDGTHVDDAGVVYVVYGGMLHRYGCTVKVRVEDIGNKVPGVVLEGGHDGREYTAWADGLDSGDFNGDGLSDLLINAYDPYHGDQPTFPARAYVVFGRQGLPSYRGYRLGVDDGASGIDSLVFEVDDGEKTRKSLGFGASALRDMNGDGIDEIAFGIGFGGGAARVGAAHIFFGRPGLSLLGPLDVELSDVTIVGDEMADPGLRFRVIEMVRPAGDVNGDGLADALITARGTRLSDDQGVRTVGATGVLLGRNELPATMGFSQLDSILHGTFQGTKGHPAVDRGADFDRDGYADILVNDPYFVEPVGGSQQYRGRLWLVRGGPALPHLIDVEADARLHLIADTGRPGMFGFTWNTGDFNGDGWPDLVVGDHYAGDRALNDHAGVVYMFLNGCSLPFASPKPLCRLDRTRPQFRFRKVPGVLCLDPRRPSQRRRPVRVRYRVSEPAVVTLTILKLRRNAAGKPLRLERATRFTHLARGAGKRTVELPRRRLRRLFDPGRYLLTGRARDTAGNRSVKRSRRFRVFERRPRRSGVATQAT